MGHRQRRRVVITGLGVIAPNGIGKDAFWSNLIAGHSAVDYITAFDASAFPCKVAAEVRDFRPDDFIAATKAKRMGRFAQFAVAAAKLAVRDADLCTIEHQHVAVAIGSAVQGNSDLGFPAHREFLSHGWRSVAPSIGLEVTAHAATAHVQQELHVEGPMTTFSSACCTGIDTLEWGAERIRLGQVDVAVVGASEAPLSDYIFALFVSSSHLATWEGPPAKASRPYDLRRSGLVLGEGAAVLVLEELDHAVARGAPIYAEVLGYASVSENNTRDPEERYVAALKTAIVTAVGMSSISPADIDYVCSHGNSTRFDDQAEAKAYRAAFGSHAYHMPISSIKSMIGQPFAASGLMQAAATALVVQNNLVPPTINYEVPDPACDLDYVVNSARIVRTRYALIHSHSLGGKVAGSHSAMVMARPIT